MESTGWRTICRRHAPFEIVYGVAGTVMCAGRETRSMNSRESAVGDPSVRIAEKTYIAGHVLCTDPLVTISKTEPSAPGGLFSCSPEIFEGKRAVHLIGYNRSIELEDRRETLVDTIHNLNRDHAESHFVVLAHSEIEAYHLSINGVPNLLANELIFVDERQFVPAAPDPDLPQFDAVYNARFLPWKRHELAAAVESLLLIYDHQGAPYEEQYFDEMRRALPRAQFHNHLAGNGEYRKLTAHETCQLINQSRVGLCLSPWEGAMRASIEYALCGLPIVSTRSIGGRDRYFVGPHVRIVDDDRYAVAAAVDLLVKQNFNKAQIRNHVAHMIAFDRHNFIININRLIKAILGVDDLFRSFDPFIGNPVRWRPLAKALGPLNSPISGV